MDNFFPKMEQKKARTAEEQEKEQVEVGNAAILQEAAMGKLMKQTKQHKNSAESPKEAPEDTKSF
jgi:hypothetical protein